MIVSANYFSLSTGEAASGCSSPAAAESALWGYAPAERDRKMSWVQVSAREGMSGNF